MRAEANKPLMETARENGSEYEKRISTKQFPGHGLLVSLKPTHREWDRQVGGDCCGCTLFSTACELAIVDEHALNLV